MTKSTIIISGIVSSISLMMIPIALSLPSSLEDSPRVILPFLRDSVMLLIAQRQAIGSRVETSETIASPAVERFGRRTRRGPKRKKSQVETLPYSDIHDQSAATGYVPFLMDNDGNVVWSAPAPMCPEMYPYMPHGVVASPVP